MNRSRVYVEDAYLPSGAFQSLGGRMRLYGGGSSAPQQTTSSTKVEYSPVEQAARDKITNAAMATYDYSAGKQGAYPGARPMGPGATTIAGQQSQLAYAGKAQGDINKAQDANNFGLHDALYASSNPYLQDAMNAATRPMVEQFFDAGGPMQQIRQGSIASGGFGGSRQGIAEGIAGGRLMQQVGDTRAKMSSDAYTKGLDVMGESIKAQPMLSMLGNLPSQLMQQVGQQQDAQVQQQENYNASARDYAQNSQWAPLQNLANIIYGGSNGTTTSTATGPGAPKQDNTGAIVGTIGSLAMMAMMM